MILSKKKVKTNGSNQGSPNLFGRGTHKQFTQQFEGRTPYVMLLFLDMLHSTKSANFRKYICFIIDKVASLGG